MPSFAPKIRVEVYVPIRYEPAYQDTLTWLIEEFTELRGGCSVNENVGGYYLSQSGKVIDDRVSIVYSDFPMNWNEPSDQANVLGYCKTLQEFLLENLWEEEILIAAYPVSHVRHKR
ncbi:MAG TPA: hypothetical protein VN476_17820 [Pyrinomonadaceae bacterium]|nr:hypothetical protein [Pyrinomonadaceae bacterium]